MRAVVTKGKQGADSIFTALEQTGEEEFARNLSRHFKKLLNLGDNFALQPAQQKIINEAIQGLRGANKLSAKLLDAF
jgi:hypothetical protein